jgi:hypothetical protein
LPSNGRCLQSHYVYVCIFRGRRLPAGLHATLCSPEFWKPFTRLYVTCQKLSVIFIIPALPLVIWTLSNNTRKYKFDGNAFIQLSDLKRFLSSFTFSSWFILIWSSSSVLSTL